MDGWDASATDSPDWSVSVVVETRQGPLGTFAEVLTETLWSDERVHSFDDAGYVADRRSPRLAATFEVFAGSEARAAELGREIIEQAAADAIGYASERPPEVHVAAVTVRAV